VHSSFLQVIWKIFGHISATMLCRIKGHLCIHNTALENKVEKKAILAQNEHIPDEIIHI